MSRHNKYKKKEKESQISEKKVVGKATKYV